MNFLDKATSVENEMSCGSFSVHHLIEVFRLLMQCGFIRSRKIFQCYVEYAGGIINDLVFIV